MSVTLPDEEVGLLVQALHFVAQSFEATHGGACIMDGWPPGLSELLDQRLEMMCVHAVLQALGQSFNGAPPVRQVIEELRQRGWLEGFTDPGSPAEVWQEFAVRMARWEVAGTDPPQSTSSRTAPAEAPH